VSSDGSPSETSPRDGVTARRIVHNTIVNGVALGAGLALAALLTPFMLHRLGSASFGIWALALTLTVNAGYLSLTDLGLQQATVRFMADARRDNDPHALAVFFTTALALFVAIGLVVAGVLIAIAPAVASLFSIHGAGRHAAVLAFAIVGAQVAMDLPSLGFRAALESAQRYLAVRLIDLGRAMLFAGLAVVVLLLDRGVVAVAAVSAAASAVALGAYWVVVHVTEPDVRFRPRTLTAALVRPLFRFSGALFVLRVLSVAYRQMDKVIVGIALTLAAVTTYEVANRIQAALLLVASIGGSAILPAAAFSRLDPATMRSLFLRATSYSVAMSLPIAVGTFIYAKSLISGWVGSGQTGATDATRLFAVWVALGTFDAAASTMLVAMGRLRPVLILTLLWVSANLALSVWLVHVWGVTGVVAGTVISYPPLLIGYTVLCMRAFDISVGSWLKRILLPNLPGFCIQVALSLATLHEVERLPPLAAAAVGIAGGTVVSIAGFLFVGVRAPERRYLRQLVSRA
jgi:O-antigen/teichoic acid export membrane protein